MFLLIPSPHHQLSWAPQARSETLRTPQNSIQALRSSLDLAGRRPALAYLVQIFLINGCNLAIHWYQLQQIGGSIISLSAISVLFTGSEDLGRGSEGQNVQHKIAMKNIKRKRRRRKVATKSQNRRVAASPVVRFHHAMPVSALRDNLKVSVESSVARLPQATLAVEKSHIYTLIFLKRIRVSHSP